MQAGDGDLLLMGEGAREFALRPGQDHAGIGVNEQLGYIRFRQESRVFRDDGVDIGRLPIDGDFPRPGQRRATGFAALPVGAR